jgi:hypothetical protein
MVRSAGVIAKSPLASPKKCAYLVGAKYASVFAVNRAIKTHVSIKVFVRFLIKIPPLK